MSIWKRRWFLRRLTIALAVGAVAAPAAQARPAGIGPGETGFGHVSADAGTQVSQNGNGTNSPLYYKLRRETGSDAPLVGPQSGPAPVQVVGPETPSGFGWADAAIFAGIGLSGALLAAGTVLAVRQRGRFARA
jgi:hypothetical protein